MHVFSGAQAQNILHYLINSTGFVLVLWMNFSSNKFSCSFKGSVLTLGLSFLFF